jgi:hypothetical protein
MHGNLGEWCQDNYGTLPMIRACKAGYRKDVSLALEVVLFLLIGGGLALTQTPPPMGPNFAWAKAFASSTGTSSVKAVAVDSKGDVYIGGEFYSGAELDVGGVVLTNHDAQDGFLAKLDRQGNLVWVKQITGSQPDGILSVAVDKSDFVYALGASRSAAVTFGETRLESQVETLGTGPWFPASGTLSTNGSTNLVAIPVGAGNRFFRLVRP